MHISRNQFVFLGILLILLGLELRFVHTAHLGPEVSNFLAQRQGKPLAAMNTFSANLTPDNQTAYRHKIQTSEKIGWLVVSVGLIAMLHAISMRKEG